ncbi:MAG: hypothetical protein IJD43_10065 [Thermoguttaceae bacterium]|nr:hypothetical protein [Thermoguttaceae bacterium]
MKAKFLSVCFAAMFVFMAGVNFCQAQVSSVPILKNSVVVAMALEEKGAQLLHMNISDLEKGGASTYTARLASGSSYVVVAVGDDERVQDLDLQVYDENDNLVEEDNDSKNIAVAQVAPKWTGEFKCKVSGYRMSHDDAFYAILIFRVD